MSLRGVVVSCCCLIVGGAVGALAVNTAGYDELQGVVQDELREMRRRALAGDELAGRTFEALNAYIHSEPGPNTVFFRKGMHIYDEGFWVH